MTDAKKRGKAARDKGKRAELELAAILREMGHDARRGHVFDHEPDIVGVKGIHIEVKRVESLNIHTAIKQSMDDSEKRQDGIPIVVHRTNKEPWLVTCRLSDIREIGKRL